MNRGERVREKREERKRERGGERERERYLNSKMYRCGKRVGEQVL